MYKKQKDTVQVTVSFLFYNKNKKKEGANMRDIGMTLNMIMRDEKCSPVRAFLLYAQNEGDTNGICKLQSKSCKKTCGRLCDKGYIKDTK